MCLFIKFYLLLLIASFIFLKSNTLNPKINRLNNIIQTQLFAIICHIKMEIRISNIQTIKADNRPKIVGTMNDLNTFNELNPNILLLK